MDKIARIRQKIERRINELDKDKYINIDAKACRVSELSSLKRFLDTLEEEPDTPEFPETFEICLYDGRTPNKENCNECSTTCSVRKEEPDKSLEEAAEEYTQKMLESWKFDSTGLRPLREPFKAGAEWQKEQMMKDAYVESLIVEDGRIELGGDPLPCLNPIILLPYPQFQPDDKVRIIIVKEDSHE